jgi:hypothetical protein
MSVTWYVVPKGTPLGVDYSAVAFSVHGTEAEADAAAKRLARPLLWPFVKPTPCEIIRRFVPGDRP